MAEIMMMLLFFETLYDFLGEDDEEEYIIGGDINTVLNSNLDTFGGIKGTHQKCRDKIIASIDNFDLADIWCVFNPSSRQYTWHSSSKPVIFSRLDYFLAWPRSAVGYVSGYRCVSDCRSRGREFDPGPVPYFRGD